VWLATSDEPGALITGLVRHMRLLDEAPAVTADVGAGPAAGGMRATERRRAVNVDVRGRW
jgi:hypothetical protein